MKNYNNLVKTTIFYLNRKFLMKLMNLKLYSMGQIKL